MKTKRQNLILTIIIVTIFMVLCILYKSCMVDTYTIDRGDYIETITNANGRVKIDTINGIITVDNYVVSRFTTEVIRLNGNIIINKK